MSARDEPAWFEATSTGALLTLRSTAEFLNEAAVVLPPTAEVQAAYLEAVRATATARDAVADLLAAHRANPR